MNSSPMCIRKMQIRRTGWKDFLSGLDLFALLLPSDTSTFVTECSVKVD